MLPCEHSRYESEDLKQNRSGQDRISRVRDESLGSCDHAHTVAMSREALIIQS